MNAPGDDGAANRDDRTDREVDAFRSDDHRHAERHGSDGHGAIKYVDQAAEQPALDNPDAEKPGRNEPVDDEDQRERERGPDHAVTQQRHQAPGGRPFGGGKQWSLFAHDPAIVSMIFSRAISAPSISPTFLRSRSTTTR